LGDSDNGNRTPAWSSGHETIGIGWLEYAKATACQHSWIKSKNLSS